MQFLIMHRTNAHWETGAIPTAQLRTLKGQTHNVTPEVLTPVVADFFAA